MEAKEATETARPGTPSAPTFRFAAGDDAPALVPLIESAYRGEASRTGWTTEADLLDGQRTDEDGVRAVVGDGASRVLLAEDGGEVLACCHIEHRGEHAYFGMFAVRPQRQGGGLGRAVLAEAERVARAEWGVREMHMTVIRQREELIAWYERRGYRRTGRMSAFPYGDERFGIPRRDDLEFELLVKGLG
ncbi:GNAT family N-acetyltransferase [Streptomyces sp. AV19]|uniref:GNAT family N-acetyltransferase n=1 Tax=Streptomyces sp. AV19 TaxID=2793068 RepID=UPI0018FE10D9|nr:GNAT family N-acetyltransferase [Streptomyces sp. AV19]MBH1937108.1 GNAT family N-acetyltransferase [Streptomyces sp. AV19]MDG4533134.1 GNAT family N-acetyltransferase [Streptomyces sp. AV19]